MGIIQNIPRDIRFLRRMMKVLGAAKQFASDDNLSIANQLENVVDNNGHRLALMDVYGECTYGEFDERANKVAHWALGQNIKPGDVVALMLENCSAYVEICFGLQKVGAVASLINTNLSGKPLAHCVNVCESSHFIIGHEFAKALDSIRDELTGAPKLWSLQGALRGAEALEPALASQSASRPDRSVRSAVKRDDTAYYIYTSGTTGNPKAAVISQFRWLGAATSFAKLSQASPANRFYLVLPLYHSTGGMAALGAVLLSGGSVFIKKKFSATEFWSDCCEHNLTRFQYIGELCRYLVNSPPHPDEKRHSIKMAIGNGLRPEVWPEFQERFAIPRILEFYGATEGNISLFNLDNKVGAVGRIPKFLAGQFKLKLARFDVENEIPVRDENGFCIESGVDEPGEALGFINPDNRMTQVDGYTDKAASDSKILRDVFEKGDHYFRSGDLMRRDKDNYYYFVDRIGDTFRWKGENVSTAEVAEVVSTCPGVSEANVYGVKVGDTDGRAGMASLVTSADFDLGTLLQHVVADLPQYARPIFIRLQGEMEITGTFKHRKVELVKEGFDPASTPDPLFFLDPTNDRYVPIDKALHRDILDGSYRF